MITRRQFLRVSGAGVLLAGGIGRTHAISAVALVMAPVIMQIAGQFLISAREQEAALRLERARLQSAWAVAQLGFGEIEQSHLVQSRAMATLGWLTPPFADTQLGVQDGQVAVERGGNRGLLTPGEVEAAVPLLDQGAPVPVPVSPAYSRVSGSAAAMTRQRLERALADRFAAVEQHYAPHAIRYLSSARRPQGQADLVSVALVERQPRHYDGRLVRDVVTVLV